MMNFYKGSFVAKLAGIVGVVIFAMAPAVAQKPSATVHGHITNPAGQDFNSGNVKFTTDQTVAYKDAKFIATAPIDSTGNYKATGVTPGDYYVYVVQGDKIVFEDTELGIQAATAAGMASVRVPSPMERMVSL